jgi:hypothetical protein
MARRCLTTFAALLALAAASAPAARAELPPQGVYESCDPGTNGNATCIARLDRVAQAGFKLVLNYALWYGTAAEIRAYLDAANARGLKVIAPYNARAWRNGSDLRNVYRRLASSCLCLTDAAFRRFAISLVRDHPATWGHYVGDEVNPNERDLVAKLSSSIRAVDPNRPRLYVALAWQEDPGDQLRPFADVPDALAIDNYPIGWGGPPEAITGPARAAREIAMSAGKEAAFVLQAFSWEMYPKIAAPEPRWPTAEEMRRMRDIALTEASPSLLLWYSMHDILKSADPERHWADLVAAAFAPDPRDKPEITEFRVSGKVTSRRAARARLKRSLARCRKARSAARRKECRARAWRAYRRGPRVEWEISTPGTVIVSIARVERDSRTARVHESPIGERSREAGRGRGALTIDGRLASALREPGRYRVRLTVRSPSGESKARPRVIRVSRR